eukprot:COSAG02_NODE_1922_length_10360_cov_38.101452_11_plen_103_part_00
MFFAAELQGNVSTAACPVSGDIEAVIAAEVGGDFARLSTEQEEAVRQINDALDCCQDVVCSGAVSVPPGNCTIMDVPTEWEGRKAYWEVFEGPLSLAAKLSE